VLFFCGFGSTYVGDQYIIIRWCRTQKWALSAGKEKMRLLYINYFKWDVAIAGPEPVANRAAAKVMAGAAQVAATD
jgi:hypothetical protein